MIPRILSIIEVIAVFLTGAIVGSWLINVVGLRSWISASDYILSASPVDFFGLAAREAVRSLIKYGSIFLLVAFVFIVRKQSSVKVILGWKHPGYRLQKHIKVVLLILIAGGFVPKLLFTLNHHGWIQGGPAHWDIFQDSWDTGFWAFMMVGSIIIPPIVEEIFFRGYMQGRLHEVFSPGAAIFLTALIFTLFHTQYLQADTLSISLSIALLISALILSYARYVTGSILPGLVAHALVNIPFAGVPALLWLLLALVLIYRWRKDVRNHLLRFRKMFN